MAGRKYKACIWGISLVACMLAMKTFIVGKCFSVDDYFIFYYQSVEAALSDISAHMRIASNFVLAVLSVCGINIVEWQRVFGVILLAAFAWAITQISLGLYIILYTDAEKSLTRYIGVWGGTLILFINVFMSENLYFSGVYIQWIIGVFSMTYAVMYIGKNNEIWKNWLMGVIALFITMGSYQLFIAQYAYIVMAIIFIRNRGKICKDSILEVARAIAAPAAALVLQVLCVRSLVFTGIIEESSSMGMQLAEIPNTILYILNMQKTIWVDGMGMYPRYVLMVGLMIIGCVLAFLMYKRKAGFGECIFVILVLLSGQCVTYMPEIVQGSLWMPPRILFPIFGVYTVGIYLICYYLRDEETQIENTEVISQFKKIGGVCIALFLVYSCIKIDEVALDKVKTNAVTQVYVDEIVNRIEKYEAQSGIVVKKVGFCYDAYVDSMRYWKFLTSKASWQGNINENPFVRPWSAITSLTYHSGRDFQAVVVPKSVEEHYGTLNWDNINWDEQLYFDNDAVYICVY